MTIVSKRWLLGLTIVAIAAAAAVTGGIALADSKNGGSATGLGPTSGLLPRDHLTEESAIQVDLSKETVRLPVYKGVAYKGTPQQPVVAGMGEEELMQTVADQRGIRLSANLDEQANLVRCAPDKIERVISNLLTNALRHTPADGTIAVCVEPAGTEILLSVEDTGEGLEPETLRHMFDHFWRADSARTSDGGGLGLAIARGLVEAHGGRIWAENRPAGGARVSFTLPTTTAASA